ncbi:Cutinase [Arthrobacter sp. ok909]|uniref:cutinase family protein n=1 Tax=Arthrobacter sp. ok909 TaxID=1761746 RepID=UPI000881DAAC|nr:cutinase family protein [Arthrobacter sp. ok909]SDP33704.1 Cutinase [Arthrobacter sp. ok909]
MPRAFTRLFRPAALLAAFALLLPALVTVTAPPAQAAGNPAVSVTKLLDAIPTLAAQPSTTPWFDKTYTVSYPGSGPAILSANADGTFVLDPFDRLQVLVGGNLVVEESFWQDDCQQTTSQMFIPLDISSFLKAGQNQITLKFLNHCPRTGSTSGYFVVGPPGTQAPYDPPNSPTVCGTSDFIAVRGSGEHSGFGSTMGYLASSLKYAVHGLQEETIDYPAQDVDLGHLFSTYKPAYIASVKTGVANLQASITAYLKNCPSGYVVLGGYSQGAEVVRGAFNNLSNQQKGKIAAVVFFGDPLFNPKDKVIDRGSYGQSKGIDVTFLDYKVTKISGEFNQRFQNYCGGLDPICNFTAANIPACLGGSTINIYTCTHNQYVQNGWVDASIPGIIAQLQIRHVII